MATVATTHSETAEKQSNFTQALVSNIVKSEATFHELRFNLSNELQSSLELEPTLRIFFDEVQQLIQCQGLRYTNNAKQIRLEFGTTDSEETRLHNANYNVSSKTDNIGELHFFRSRRFAEAELATLEMLIGVLFYPLRNALTYRSALENSYIDTLTGLSNRLAMNITSIREVKLAKRHHKALSLLVIDVDHFKHVNDKHGHRVGDMVLCQIARVISDTLRETDHVFRYGGEEFVAILNETSMDNANMTAERIRAAIAATAIRLDSGELQATASIGVASLCFEDNFDNLFQRADDAMYDAKEKGRNRITSNETGNEIHKKIA